MSTVSILKRKADKASTFHLQTDVLLRESREILSLVYDQSDTKEICILMRAIFFACREKYSRHLLTSVGCIEKYLQAFRLFAACGGIIRSFDSIFVLKK